MRRKFLLIIFLRFVICHKEDSVRLFKIVKAISEFHHFSFLVILNSNKTETDNYLYEELKKPIKSAFPLVVKLSMENYEDYADKIHSSQRTMCLKIVNGNNDMDRDAFAKLSNRIDLGDNDVWLLYMGDSIPLDDYLESLALPFDFQFIVAYSNSERIDFIAPYRVAEDYPLRTPVVGHWSEFNGLDLRVVRIASIRRDLEGFKFRAGTLNYPPATIVVHDKSGGFIVKGYFAEIWNDLADRLNFTFDYKLSIDGATGSLNPDKKTWNGLIGMLMRDEIDVAVTELTITTGRSRVVDPGIPMMTSELQVFFSQSGGEYLEWGSILRPFRTETWLVIFVWFVVAAIALSFFYTMGCRYDLENFVFKQEYTIIGSFFIVFRAFTAQGGDMAPQSSSSRIIFSSAYLIMGILLPSYSAALISYLTVNTPIKPFTSLETMLQARTHKLLAAKKTAKYSYFSEAKDTLLKEVYEKLLKPVKESDLPANTLQGLEKICKKNKMAFFGSYLSSKKYIDKLFNEKGCIIMSLETPVSYADAAIAFPKGSPYALMINMEVQRMTFEGALNRFERRTWPQIKRLNDLNFEAIEIQHVIQIHVLLLSGYLFATFLLLLEAFISKRKSKPNKRRLRIIQVFPIYQSVELEKRALNGVVNIVAQIEGK